MSRSTVIRSSFLALAAVILAVSTASAAGPFQFYSVTPCRIVDTRGNGFTGVFGPPSLSSGQPRSFPVTGQCTIPSDAKAVALNVTVVSPTLEGFIKIWPANLPQPPVSTINFVANEPAIANGAIVPLALDNQGNTVAGNQISLVYGTAVAGGHAQLILDVTGYFKTAP
jgi:hypothetical protein